MIRTALIAASSAAPPASNSARALPVASRSPRRASASCSRRSAPPPAPACTATTGFTRSMRGETRGLVGAGFSDRDRIDSDCGSATSRGPQRDSDHTTDYVALVWEKEPDRPGDWLAMVQEHARAHRMPAPGRMLQHPGPHCRGLPGDPPEPVVLHDVLLDASNALWAQAPGDARITPELPGAMREPR